MVTPLPRLRVRHNVVMTFNRLLQFSLLAGLILSSCAPRVAQVAGLAIDPVFASGQEWRITFPDGRFTALTVGARDLGQPQGAAYRSPVLIDNVLSTVTFYWDPVDADPDYVSLGYVPNGNPTAQEHCVVRKPGRGILPTYVLSGVYTTTPGTDPRIQTYLLTGVQGDLQGCSLTRNR